MKKIFSLMLVITSILCFTACSGDDEEGPNIPTSHNMKVGEILNFKYKSNWASSNTFVATVDNNGVVTAIRKGDANIYSTDKDLSCYISVSPSFTLYNDPITDWGSSKSSIISRKGTPDNETTEDSEDGERTLLSYYPSLTITPIEMYIFEDNLLASSAIAVATSYTEELLEHLSQRSIPVAVDLENFSLYFIDAETFEDAETIIWAQLFNENYWLVMYMYTQNTISRSAVNQNELFERLKSKVESIGIIKE